SPASEAVAFRCGHDNPRAEGLPPPLQRGRAGVGGARNARVHRTPPPDPLPPSGRGRPRSPELRPREVPYPRSSAGVCLATVFEEDGRQPRTQKLPPRRRLQPQTRPKLAQLSI